MIATLKRRDAIELAGFDNMDAKRALEVGKAAEHLVCADLILRGYHAFLSDQGLPYDVVMDRGGQLIRIQVKCTQRPKPVPHRPGSGLSYYFQIRRAGKGAQRIIGNDEFDLVALVALDIRTIAYLRMGDRVLQTISLRVPGCPLDHGNKSRGNIDHYPLERALLELDN